MTDTNEFEEIERLIAELDLPIEFPDLMDQVSEWRHLDSCAKPFGELKDPAFLEAAVAVQLRLLMLNQGLDVVRVLKFLHLLTLLPEYGFKVGAMAPTGEVC